MVAGPHSGSGSESGANSDEAAAGMGDATSPR